MRLPAILLAVLSMQLLFGYAATADQQAAEISGYPQVLAVTTHGEFIVELEAARAPITVANFLKLVEDGYYDGTIFHRVINGFVAQGGGYGSDYSPRRETALIANESGNGLTNDRGTIAMAREDKPHTANSQFYINLADNHRLDPRAERWGYTVFGRVISGMDTLDQIGTMPTGPAPGFDGEVPAMKVIVKSMRRLSQQDIEARAAAELAAAEKALEALQEQ